METVPVYHTWMTLRWRISIGLVITLGVLVWQLNLNTASHYVRQGNALVQDGAYVLAILQYQEALEQRPGDARISRALGLAHYRMGNYSGAAAALENALDWGIEPREPTIRNLILLYEELGASGRAEALRSELSD